MRKTRNEVAKQLVKPWASLEVQGLHPAADFLQAAVRRVRWGVWRAGTEFGDEEVAHEVI